MRIELTRRGDYAVRAAVALVILDDGLPVSARRIAGHMGIPSRFLAHVLADLVRAGIVIGTTGRSGGYRLAAPAADLDLLRIVDAVEDHGEPRTCVMRGGACMADGTCIVHAAFDTATQAMRRELSNANLADMIRRDGSGPRPQPDQGLGR